MALFGVPRAYEDHAQRACYAALQLRECLRVYSGEMKHKHGVGLFVRTGVNSGEVIVGRIEGDRGMTYTVQGHTVGIARRMEQLASRGQIVLAEPTARLVEGYFELRDRGEFAIKGVDKGIRIFELEYAASWRTRLDVARMHGLSGFVGRADELAFLESALEQALAGRGQVVGVVSEEGVGKSRLCSEFVHGCRARGITAYEAHCLGHGHASPLLPVRELWHSYFGISAADDEPAIREKVRNHLRVLGPGLDQALQEILEFLGASKGEMRAASSDPESQQRPPFPCFVHLLLMKVRSERQPVVVLIDDLHWADRASEAFVGQLAEIAASAPLLLLVNFRPDYGADWTHKFYYRQIALKPLDPPAMADLLANILGHDPSVTGLQALICDKTAGNPFFAEEVVRSLAETTHLEGVSGAYRLASAAVRIEIPACVQSLLAARIDRLPEREKHVLQVASVIGREFSGAVLARVVECSVPELSDSLRTLVLAGLVTERALYPVAEYAFRHPLIHEVSYDSQLADRRKRTHAAVAQAIETLDAAQLDERSALLAYHWERAGEPLLAARWNERTATLAQTSDADTSLAYWRKVTELAVTPRVDDAGHLPADGSD